MFEEYPPVQRICSCRCPNEIISFSRATSSGHDITITPTLCRYLTACLIHIRDVYSDGEAVKTDDCVRGGRGTDATNVVRYDELTLRNSPNKYSESNEQNFQESSDNK